MINVRAYQRSALALLALALAGCQSPVSATQQLPPTATVTALPVASSTNIPASPTASLTPPLPATSSPTAPNTARPNRPTRTPTATLIPSATQPVLPQLQAAGTYAGGGAAFFSPDGCCLVTFPVGGVYFYKLTSSQSRWSFYPPDTDLSLSGFHSEEAAAFSLDGAQVAVGGSEEYIYLLDAATGQLVAKQKHWSYISGLAFVSDGTRLVASGCGENPGLTVWDLISDNLTRFRVFGCPMITVSGEDTVVLSGLGEVTLFDVQTGQVERALSNAGSSFSMAASPDGTMLAAEFGRGLQLWRLADGTALPDLVWRDRQETIRWVAWSVTNQLALLDDDGQIVVWVLVYRVRARFLHG